MDCHTVFEAEALPQLDALRSYAKLLCRDDHQSSDLVQETMMKALRYFDSYQEGTNCRAWLFQICKNSYINTRKHRQREFVPVDFQEMESHALADREAGKAHAISISLEDRQNESAQREMLGDEVARALSSIPMDYQTAIILSDIEGYTYEEIAEFSNSPVGTIRSRIHRGRKMLATHLAKHAHSLGYDTNTQH